MVRQSIMFSIIRMNAHFAGETRNREKNSILNHIMQKFSRVFKIVNGSRLSSCKLGIDPSMRPESEENPGVKTKQLKHGPNFNLKLKNY